MTTQDTGFNLELSRRKLLAAAGIGAGIAAGTSLIGTKDGEAAAPSPQFPDPVATPPVSGLHLEFGSDASAEMVVSWHTLQPVRNPSVLLGHLDGELEQAVEGEAASYTMQSQARPFTPIMQNLHDFGPTPLICTARCTRAPRQNRHLPHLPARPRTP